jgi:glyoxylase-like metal-dependent hydrolase (beta-lactamase superfamily II)
MNSVKIIRIRLFLANSYLVVRGNKAIIVDTGDPGHGKHILRAMAAHNVTPGMVSLIHITHAHIDHYGSVFELKQTLNVPVAVHKTDLPYLEAGVQAPLVARNKMAGFLKAIGRNFKVKERHGLRPEIILENSLDLQDFGVAGKIIATPGHTLGSTSIILESGEAFIGDLLVHQYFLKGRPVKPPFMHDFGQHEESMQKLARQGVKILYPGHGNPMPTDSLWR